MIRKYMVYLFVFSICLIGCKHSSLEITKTSVEIPKWHKRQIIFGFEIIRTDIKENGVYEINNRNVFVNGEPDLSKSYSVTVSDKSIKKVNLLHEQKGVKFRQMSAKQQNLSSTIDKIELSNDAWYKLTNLYNLTTVFLYIDEEGNSFIHRVNLHNNW